MICDKCKSNNNPGAFFCCNCGYNLQNSQNFADLYVGANPKKPKNVLVIVLIAIASLALIVTTVLLVCLLGGRSNNSYVDDSGFYLSDKAQSTPENLIEAIEDAVNNKDSERIIDLGLHKAKQKAIFHYTHESKESLIAILDDVFETKYEDLVIEMKILGEGCMEQTEDEYKDDYYDRYGMKVDEFEMKKVRITASCQGEEVSFVDEFVFCYKINGKWYSAMPDIIYSLDELEKFF